MILRLFAVNRSAHHVPIVGDSTPMPPLRRPGKRNSRSVVNQLSAVSCHSCPSPRAYRVTVNQIDLGGYTLDVSQIM